MKSILRRVIQAYRKRMLSSCGDHSYIARDCRLYGNIFCGSHDVIGSGALFVSTRAEIHIHDHVIFGPNVTIYTGDHPTDVLGKHISELTDEDKNDSRLDQNVVIESG